MKNYLVLSILLICLVFPSGVHAQFNPDVGTVIISKKYSPESWTNVTISDKTFVISSDDSFYDGLTGELFGNYWDTISTLLDDANFWNFEGNNASDLFLFASNGDNSHMVGMDVNFFRPDPMLDLKSEILRKYEIITGGHNHYPLWPIDMEISVMESYPPQYGISAKVIRGNDLLTVVDEFDLNLAGGFSTTDDLLWLTECYEIQNKTASMASGGQISEVQFDTFSMGSINDDLNYSNAVFLVRILSYNNSLFYYHNQVRMEIQINIFKGDLISKASDSNSLSWNQFGLILVAVIPILKKRYRK